MAEVWMLLHCALDLLPRLAAGRKSHSAIVIMNGQSMEMAEQSGIHGFDGHKRVDGRNRYILVRHCHVNRCADVKGFSVGDCESARCVMVAGFLSPDPNCPSANSVMSGRNHEIRRRPEVAIDHHVRRQEPLRLTVRFEPFHLSLSSSRGSMRLLSSIALAVVGDQRRERPTILHGRPAMGRTS
jgi:hypothetical protein